MPITNWKIVPSDFKLPNPPCHPWPHLIERKCRAGYEYPIGSVIEVWWTSGRQKYLITGRKANSVNCININLIDSVHLQGLFATESCMLGRLNEKGTIEYFADMPAPKPVLLKDIPDLTVVRIKDCDHCTWRALKSSQYYCMYKDGSGGYLSSHEACDNSEVVQIIGRMEFSE